MPKPKPISREAMRSLRWKAATDPLRGRLLGSRVAEWQVSGPCTEPKSVALEAARGPSNALPPVAYLEVRCRKCEACRRERARSWAYRMAHEIEVSPRTWFVTLTMRPAEHHRNLMLARSHIRKTSLIRSEAIAHSREKPEQIRQELCDVARYLKRLRKGGHYQTETGEEKTQPETRFRYALVVEHHKSGEPHFHMLLHEMAGQAPLARRWLAHQWPHGWGVWKVAQKASAWYCAKYVSKEGSCRVRASAQYGQYALSIDPQPAVKSVGGSCNPDDDTPRQREG